MKIISASLFLIVFAANCLPVSTQAQTLYYPAQGEDWAWKAPKSVGVDENRLQQAVDFALANEYSGSKDLRIAILAGFSREPYHKIAGPTKKRGGAAGMIIKDGYVIAQWGDVKRVDMTFSVTKSYLSTVAGLALDAGLIASVHDSVNNYVWDGTFAGNHNSQITWEDLLNQSSDWSGRLFGMPDWGDRPSRDGELDDWKYRELRTPGTSFKYNDVRVNVLSYSLLNVWRQPLPQVLKERIMDPIGASTTWRWFGYENSWVTIDGVKMQSVSGGGHSGGGIFISAEDHARFGLLFARNGQWEGKQLISEDWVRQVQQPSAANESYGLMWWLNRGDRKTEGVSEFIYLAAGFGGNYIIIDQENDLVVVTRWLEPAKMGEMLKLVLDAL